MKKLIGTLLMVGLLFGMISCKSSEDKNPGVSTIVLEGAGAQ